MRQLVRLALSLVFVTCNYAAAKGPLAKLDPCSSATTHAEDRQYLEPISTPQAVYPHGDTGSDVSQQTILRLDISREGEVTHAEVASSGVPERNGPALEIAGKWKFKPLMRESATSVEIAMPFGFALEDTPLEPPSAPNQPMPDGFVINERKPSYPQLAHHCHVRGTVQLLLTVAQDGRVRKVDTIFGKPELVPEAENAAKEWAFFRKPGAMGELKIYLTFNFVLKSDPAPRRTSDPTVVTITDLPAW